ncbi:MAG: 5-formyltetrahydrofolate cyclo-ligase [Desulfuromonadales bacterium]|nr:5-formyltetrahydrofolate cyclo-ligase [Desulfuromonadales bacterium]
MGKQLIRKQFLDSRKQLDRTTSHRLSLEAQQRLIGSELFIRAQSLALYSPINNEVATDQIHAFARECGKRIYYPRVVGEKLEFIEIDCVAQLAPGAFGVAEPIGETELSGAKFDLIIVPGIAFDLHGHRLGYGRGFYDRQLAEKSPKTVTIGLCFEMQLCERLPTETHDQPLDYVVTETRYISCQI